LFFKKGLTLFSRLPSDSDPLNSASKVTETTDRKQSLYEDEQVINREKFAAGKSIHTT
jgi:hypothetical protein